MHGRLYTEDHARRLVPILRSILIEVGERAQAIAELETRLASKLTRPERDDAEALLASHRRETRLAVQELARHGCTIDELEPARVLIPGEDGDFDSGFVWNSRSEALERRSALVPS